METTVSVHVPVLLHEIITALSESSFASSTPADGGVASKGTPRTKLTSLDGTLGGAGHAKALKEAFAKKGIELQIIGLDRDLAAIARARTTLGSDAILEVESFRNLDQVLKKHAVTSVDLILFDLGISSDELETSGRGFSFQKDEPLLMTLGDPKTYPFTAKEIVNTWDESILANIIFGYAEDRFSRRIARAIVVYRTKKPIETSGELREIVKSAVPAFVRRGKIHPATKTFQALRIAVNDELNALREGLAKGYEALAPHGKMAVISFHSLEDKIVKDFYKAQAKDEAKNATIITKKPITPSAQEIAENPRSRSAKLRIIEKH